jgi:hypothetical protein
MDLSRFCAGHLSVWISHKETGEMIKHREEFKLEAVRVALSSGLPRERVAADLGIGKPTHCGAKLSMQLFTGDTLCARPKQT